MGDLPDWARRSRAHWRYTGRDRPEFAREPAEGEISVWDFPRPPRIEAVPDEISVCLRGVDIARSRASLRVLETASPPTYYVPAGDVRVDLLVPCAGGSRCEWKGEARYWDVVTESVRQSGAAWDYPEPFSDFHQLRDHFAFYPTTLECFVGGARVKPQPGGFYAGWVTPDLVGPFKGEPGTEGL